MPAFRESKGLASFDIERLLSSESGHWARDIDLVLSAKTGRPISENRIKIFFLDQSRLGCFSSAGEDRSNKSY